MGEAKDLVIGLIITLSLMGLFSFALFRGLADYELAVPDKYNKTLTMFSNTTSIASDLKTQKQLMYEKTNSTTSAYSLFDIAGFYFQEALAPFKLLFSSLNVFEAMTDTAAESLSDTPMGDAITVLGNMLKLIVVAGLVFLALAVFLKWEL